MSPPSEADMERHRRECARDWRFEFELSLEQPDLKTDSSGNGKEACHA